MSKAFFKFSYLLIRELLRRQGGSRVKKNMLILFERFHRCGVNAFYGMSEFFSVQKLSAFQLCWPFDFSIVILGVIFHTFYTSFGYKNWNIETNTSKFSIKV